MKCRTCGTTLTAGALLCGECGTSAIAPRPTLGDTAHHDRRTLLAALSREQSRRTPPPPPASPFAHPGSRTSTPTPAAPARPQPAAPTPTTPPAPPPASPAPPTPHHPPAHAADPAAAKAARPVFHLAFSTGETVRVSGSGLVGRNPAPGPDDHPDYLVQLVDPARSISKTHLEFAVEGDGFWVRDRGSTNGTRIAPALDDLAPGEWHQVHRGDRIEFGDQYLDLT